ncbi:MAG: ABC transporter ATP-binding protein [Desulfobacterales bacterium]|nr:ABC transporter ATP-binding protein [Desulfobacterales bacterium]MBF0398053.1 ABC transporter ATP-binding protein [Desulfobacterales bacterium]
MIELKDLTKRFGDFTAVDNISLCIPKGEIFGFIGPNGAGKTTTIKMMGGILGPSAGVIKICGIDMIKFPQAAKQKIGFIPDRPFLYEKLTGIEFLKFTADLYGVDEKLFLMKAEEKLSLFSLSDWADELIESYSHGMKQRLIMASALLHDPEVIVVDEPMVGLDPAGIKMVKILFKNLAKTGVTFFMSTHTLKVAEDVCDRIGIINKGKLIAVGTTKELMQKAELFSADLEEIFLTLTEDNIP